MLAQTSLAKPGLVILITLMLAACSAPPPPTLPTLPPAATVPAATATTFSPKAAPTGASAIDGDRFPEDFGVQTALALDANGDPLVAYVVRDLNHDGDAADSIINFIRWDRTQEQWAARVTVSQTGAIEGFGSDALALTFDAAANRIGLVFPKAGQGFQVAYSADMGITWQVESLAFATIGAQNPALALTNGQTYLLFSAAEAGVIFASRAGTSGAFNVQPPPLLEGMAGLAFAPAGLTVDSTGTPALAYWMSPAEGGRFTLGFWRPGEAAPHFVSNNSEGGEGLSARLAFGGRAAPGGEQPAIAFFSNRSDESLWFSRSTDGGDTWAEPAAVPRDGGQMPGYPFTLAISPQGQAAITYAIAGGNDEGARCGLPKLARSADLAQWSVCSPDADGLLTGGAAIDNASLAFDPNGKLSLLFRNTYRTEKMGPGLWLWREP